MCLVAKNIETNPLNRMKHNQTQSEAQIINHRNGIGYKFFHRAKIDCKSKE